ncbi:DUF4260 domain-containing protein [Niabella aquatica]
MKILLKLEETVMVLLSIFLLWNSNASWFWYLLLLLGPDISMVGYMISNKAGAFFYNLFHHKGVAIIVFVSGIYWDNELLQQVGIVLFGHSSLDRIFGYGLKYEKGFEFTHLGIIGKNNSE